MNIIIAIFPQPTRPIIGDEINYFLDDKRRQLESTTIRKYDRIINLFQFSMSIYAYQALNSIEPNILSIIINQQPPAESVIAVCLKYSNNIIFS